MIIKCPKCQSINLIKRGFRQTENRGKIQRYSCKDCDKRFVQNDGFFRMRNAPQKITLCLDLFYKGVSTRQIQSHLQAFYPHNSSWVTIYKWIIKYSKKISKFTDNIKVNIGSEVQIDEMEYHRRKSHKLKAGISCDWFVDTICPKTKFMIASEYFSSRSLIQIKKILKEVKDKTQNQVKIVTSDGWLAYPTAIQSVFGYDRHEQRFNVIHHRNVAIKDEGFNYPIERLHNNIRTRTKVFRGFHGNLDSAKSIMKGFEIYYNFIRPHLTLKGKTPSELATDVRLENPNKWLELINLSNEK
jgi:transposase-like protein